MWWVLMGVFAVAGAQEPHRPPSPCPNIYSYEKDILDGWRGLISIITPPKFSEMMLVVRLSSPVPITADNVGKLELKGGSDTIDELAGEVAEGRKFTLRYFVIFPKGKPIPTLLSVNVNGKEFCRAKDVPTNTRSHITLHTKLSTGLHFDSDEANGFEPPNGTNTTARPPPWAVVFPNSAEVSSGNNGLEDVHPTINQNIDSQPDRRVLKLLHMILDLEQERLRVELERLKLERLRLKSS